MKKIVAITLALLVLAGCSSETYKSGLGMVNSIGSSKAATEEAAGLAQADVTAASVMLDSKNTIVGISFDVSSIPRLTSTLPAPSPPTWLPSSRPRRSSRKTTT